MRVVQNPAPQAAQLTRSASHAPIAQNAKSPGFPRGFYIARFGAEGTVEQLSSRSQWSGGPQWKAAIAGGIFRCSPAPLISCSTALSRQVGTDPTGFEPSSKTPVKPALLKTGGAESGALDADLRALVDVWPSLSASRRRSILVIAQRSKKSKALRTCGRHGRLRAPKMRGR